MAEETNRFLKGSLEWSKKRVKELHSAIDNINKKLKALPETERKDVLKDWNLEDKIQVDDYRFLNKLLDRIDVDSEDNRELSLYSKHINDLIKFVRIPW